MAFIHLGDAFKLQREKPWSDKLCMEEGLQMNGYLLAFETWTMERTRLEPLLLNGEVATIIANTQILMNIQQSPLPTYLNHHVITSLENQDFLALLLVN